MSARSGGRSTRETRETGQALVEFSLAFIVFVVLLMAIFDFGRGIFMFNGVSQAAREIARATSVEPGIVLGAGQKSLDAAAVPWVQARVDTLIGLPGDYNLDGLVDAADYVVWRDTEGSTTQLEADGDFNGIVDVGDWIVWQASFGAAAGQGTAAPNYAVVAAVPEPAIPKPGEEVSLKLEGPEGVKFESVRVRVQTELFGPWVEVETEAGGPVDLGAFDRPTPVSYRVDVTSTKGEAVELWGYFQVRVDPRTAPARAGAVPGLALAEVGGFEPPRALTQPAFQASAIGH